MSMGWKTINGRSYYYRSRREGGRVRTEYIGPAGQAELFALLDAEDRERREAERERERAEREAVERLRDLSQRRSTLRWDDRLGVIAASLGTEQSVYMLFALSVTTAIVLLGMQLSITNAALSLSLAGAFPLLVGFWFRGGPVFRVTGVEVRRRNQPATRRTMHRK